jgi:hypothetical protein
MLALAVLLAALADVLGILAWRWRAALPAVLAVAALACQVAALAASSGALVGLGAGLMALGSGLLVLGRVVWAALSPDGRS